MELAQAIALVVGVLKVAAVLAVIVPVAVTAMALFAQWALTPREDRF